MLETKSRKSILGNIGTSALAVWFATAGCSFDSDKLRSKYKDGSVLVTEVGGDVAVADAGQAQDDAMADDAMADDAALTADLASRSDQAGDRYGLPNDAAFLADSDAPDAAEDAGPEQVDVSFAEARVGLDVGGIVGTDAPLDDTGGTTLSDAATDLGRDLGIDSSPDARPDLAVDRVDAIPLPSGLVAYYTCESADGLLLRDQSGNGNDATLGSDSTANGGTATGYRFEAGKVGTALTLLKAGHGYVSMPPSIFQGATALTIAFWIKVNTIQNWARAFDVGLNMHLSSAPYTGAAYFFLTPQNATSQSEFAITANGFRDEQLLYADPIVPTDGWRHIAVTIDGSQGVIYIKAPSTTGTKATSSTVILRPADLGSMDYAYLGKSPWSVDPYFDGQLDEVRVYRRALSAAEIQTLAQVSGP